MFWRGRTDKVHIRHLHTKYTQILYSKSYAQRTGDVGEGKKGIKASGSTICVNWKRWKMEISFIVALQLTNINVFPHLIFLLKKNILMCYFVLHLSNRNIIQNKRLEIFTLKIQFSNFFLRIQLMQSRNAKFNYHIKCCIFYCAKFELSIHITKCADDRR